MKLNEIMDIEFILNHALNKALCSKARIKQPNSNEIATFVSKYLETEKLTLTSVVESFCLCTDDPMRLEYSMTKCASCKKIVEN